MTLDQCFDTYKGTVVSVDGNPANAGQCVQWADVVLAHVYGAVTHYGNAIDWWNDPRELLDEGFEKIADGSIRKGDFVIYNQGVGSVYGHIDVAMSDGSKSGGYTGADSNWGHDLTVHAVNHNDYYNQFILGSLRLKGGGMPVTTTDLNIQRILAYFIGGRDGRDGRPNALKGESDADLQGHVGKEVLSEINNWFQSTESSNYRQAIDKVYDQAASPPGFKPYSGPDLFVKN